MYLCRFCNAAFKTIQAKRDHERTCWERMLGLPAPPPIQERRKRWRKGGKSSATSSSEGEDTT